MSGGATGAAAAAPDTTIVFFPQTYSHITHTFNTNGELRTALITGGDRLVVLKEGVCVAASSPLLLAAPVPASPSQAPSVQCICMCMRDYTICIAVATSQGVLLFEMNDSALMGPSMAHVGAAGQPPAGAATATEWGGGGGGDGELRCRRVRVPAAPVHQPQRRSGGGAALFYGVEHSLAPQRRGLQVELGSSGSTDPPTLQLATRRDAVVDMCFVGSDNSQLCVLYRDEAVLLALTPPATSRTAEDGARERAGDDSSQATGAPISPSDPGVDQLLWRSAGAYRMVAACPTYHHIALVLHSSTIVVFQNQAAANTASPVPVGWESGAGEVEPSMAVSTALTASLGVHRIERVQWHRVSTHTLLCATCVHPRSGAKVTALYTVQSLHPVRPYTNVVPPGGDHDDHTPSGGVLEDLDDAWDSRQCDHTLDGRHCHVSRAQLVPCGTLLTTQSSTAITTTTQSVNSSTSSMPPLHRSAAPPGSMGDLGQHGEVLTSIVPRFSPAPVATAHILVNRMDLLHIDSVEGNVCTSSYHFGHQKHASFAKQRAAGLHCKGLLQPLLRLYGSLAHAHVLPLWKGRPMEVGRTPPQAAQLTTVRRYRFVGRFTTGVTAMVMVDLTASVYRVECFLALGRFPTLSLAVLARPGAGGRDGGEALVAGLLGEAVPSDTSEAECAKHYRGCTGVALFSQRRTGKALTTALVAVLPVSPPDVTDVPDASVPLNDEEKVLRFMQAKCPDKVRMMPALLRSVNGSADRLLTQLTLRYGAVEKGEETVVDEEVPQCHTSVDREEHGVWCLRGGRATTEGVTLDATHYAQGSGAASACRPQAVRIQIPRASLESLGPVEQSVTVGGARIAVAAEAIASLAPQPAVDTRDPACAATTPSPRSVTCSVRRAEGAGSGGNETAVLVDVTGPLIGRTEVLVAAASETPLVRVLSAKAMQLVCNDTVVAVHLLRCDSTGTGVSNPEVRLYGLPAVQSISSPLVDGVGTEEGRRTFSLECVLPNISAFFLGRRGEVVVVTSAPAAGEECGGGVLQRWLRCFPSSAGGDGDGRGSADGRRAASSYRYVRDHTWQSVLSGPTGASARITAATCMDSVEILSLSGGRRRHARTQFLLTTTHADYVRSWVAPCIVKDGGTDDGEGGGEDGDDGDEDRDSVVAQYHPDTLMQLISLGQWGLLKEVLHRVATTAQAGIAGMATIQARDEAQEADTSETGLSSSTCPGKAMTAAEMARVLCRGVLPQSLHAFSALTASTLSASAVQPPLEPPPIPLDSLEVRAAADGSRGNSSASSGLAGLWEAFADDTVLDDLTRLLPQVTLSRLSTRSQLALLCVVEALSTTRGLARNVDEAAARFFFFHTLAALRGRLRVRGYTALSNGGDAAGDSDVDVSSILMFATAKTASRMVTTASYLWAAMSDSQSVLFSKLFDADFPGAGGTTTITAASSSPLSWPQVEGSGAAYWARTPQQLRTLAERVARTQYRTDRDLTTCALMYCAAGKATTLAALCKAQGNTRLYDFFTRDFTEDRHRSAAAANAFAAVGKNLPLYGAAFFLLAGDARSAAQVIMQRHGNASLALFVLRAAPPPLTGASSPVEDIEWFIAQQMAEQSVCGAPDMWEEACLAWVMGPTQAKVQALRRLAAHTTAHPEVLSALRYARDRVSCLTQRGGADGPGTSFLSPARELVCVLRLGRYSLARQLQLSAVLHYSDVSQLLARVLGCQRDQQQRDAAAAVSGRPQPGRCGSAAARGDTSASRMQANYNTGTLVFKGFDDSDEDAGQPERQDATGPLASADLAGAADGEADDLEVICVSPDTERAVCDEVRYAQHQLLRREQTRRGLPWSHQMANEEERVFGSVVALALGAVQGCGSEVFEQRLSMLLELIHSALVRAVWNGAEARISSLAAPQTAGSSATPGDDCAPGDPLPTLMVSVLRLLLSEEAVSTRNYLLASALQQVPNSVSALLGGMGGVARDCAACSHSTTAAVVAFFSALYYHLREARTAVMRGLRERDHREPSPSIATTAADGMGGEEDAQAHKSIWEKLLQSGVDGARDSVFSPATTTTNALPTATRQPCLALSDAESVMGLFSWVSMRGCLRACEAWHRLASEDDAHGPSETTGMADCVSARHPLAWRVLLCYCMCFATLRYNTVADESFMRIGAKTPLGGGASTGVVCDTVLWPNPNGVLIELESILRRVMEMLGARLVMSIFTAGLQRASEAMDTGGASVSASLRSCGPLLVQVCFSYLSAFQRSSIPVAQTHLHLEAFVQALDKACSGHDGAARLLHSLDGYDEAADDGVDSVGGVAGSATGGTSSWGVAVRSSSGFFLHRTSTDALTQLEEIHAGAGPIVSCTLQSMESSSLRRHHTHGTLRRMLLSLSLRGNLEDPALLTDRLLLTQSTHSIVHLDFDRSSCDSLVWSTEAGTEAAHGVREVLAGGNEAVLLSYIPERNIATEVFSVGLSIQMRRLHAARADASGSPEPAPAVADEAATTTAAAAETVAVAATENRGEAAQTVLGRRPLTSVAAGVAPCSHPHLPFFLAGQRDGYIDLYPFASHQPVATFRCPHKSPVITPIAYSHNGYLFAAGLHNGSVAVWRFTAAALGSAPCFHSPGIFCPGKAKAVLFCGDRSSLLVAVGVAMEPYRTRACGPNACFSAGTAVGTAGSTVSPKAWEPASGGLSTPLSPQSVSFSVLAPLPGTGRSGPQSSRFSPSRDGVGGGSTAAVEAMVGEMLLLDISLYPGRILVRSALPFIPEFAVYLPPLDAVLCVSVEGLMAVYEVRAASLTVIGEAPLHTLLRPSPALAAKRTPTSPPPPPTVTAVAVSPFDPLVVLGTSNGFALVLSMATVESAMRERQASARQSGEDAYTYEPSPTSQTAALGGRVGGGGVGAPLLYSVLSLATRVQVAPVLTSRSFVEEVVFGPSVLLAGLRDGKLLAAVLVPQALRQMVTHE